MYLLNKRALSYDTPGQSLSSPFFKVKIFTLLTPSSPSMDKILLKLYLFCFTKCNSSLNLALFLLNWTLAFQSSRVINPSLLLSRILNSSWACCSVISIEICLQTFHSSFSLRTWDFLLMRPQKASNPSSELY